MFFTWVFLSDYQLRIFGLDIGGWGLPVI